MPAIDTIVVASHIRTLDPANPHARAVAISGGHIAAVGGTDDVAGWRDSGTEVIDLGDGVLTPGLVDGHIHPVAGSVMADGLDLSGVSTPAELRAVLSQAARKAERGEWITGFGLEHNAFQGASIAATAIDEALGDVPALIRLFDGHSALASTPALRLAGVTGPREFASRSAVVCDRDGSPTGFLLEAEAIDLVQRHVPQPPEAELRSRVRLLLESMARCGLTGGHVMDAEVGGTEFFTALETDGDLPLRLRIAPWCMPGAGEEEIGELLRRTGEAGRRWHRGAVKLFIDGTVEGGTAWLEHPDCHGENNGSFWRDQDAYTRVVRRFAAAGVQTVTHAIGDAGVRHALDSLSGIDHRGIRHRIEHIETLPAAQTRRFGELGVVASMQPTHAAYTRADHSDEWSRRLGGERADRAWSCKDIHTAGATLVLGSDWPIAHFDPRHVLASARLRRLPGTDTAPIAPTQAITGIAALEGMTRNAAIVAGEQTQAGRIARGYRADLTSFAVDPVNAPADEVAEAPITLTMVAGSTTHRL